LRLVDRQPRGSAHSSCKTGRTNGRLDQSIELFDIIIYDMVAKVAVSPLGVGKVEQRQQAGKEVWDGISELIQRVQDCSPRHSFS
jgi:hypothetical protein